MSIYTTPIASAHGQNVRPSDGAKLYFYEVGTTTAKTVYSDAGLTTPLSSPVVADGSGRFPLIYLQGNFKNILTDKNDVQIWEEDDLRASDSGVNILGDFDSSTNAGNYPESGATGDQYRVVEQFVLAAPSGEHQLYVGDFIVANKVGATAIDADWDIQKGRVWLIDEDDLSSDSAILAPSQQSVKAYADAIISREVVTPWDAARTYGIGDYVMKVSGDAVQYRAIQESTGETPVNNPSYWLVFGGVLNVLTSTDAHLALAANMGKTLGDRTQAATISSQGIRRLRKRIICTKNGAYQIDTGAGSFRFANGSGEAYAAGFSKLIYTDGSPWAAGSDEPGLADGVTMTNDTWYHFFALSSADGGTVDFGFDSDIDATNLLADAAVIAAGLVQHRRQCSVFKESTANIKPFIQTASYFAWAAPYADGSPSVGTSADQFLTGTPVGVKTRADLQVKLSWDNLTGVRLGVIDPDIGVDPPVDTTGCALYADDVTGLATNSFPVMTDALGKVSMKTDTASYDFLSFAVDGWTDVELDD